MGWTRNELKKKKLLNVNGLNPKKKLEFGKKLNGLTKNGVPKKKLKTIFVDP